MITKDLLKKFSVYTAANLLNKGLVFLLVPILTAYLTPEENGALSLFTTTLGLVFPLVVLQITSAINVEYFRKDHGEDQFSTFVFSGVMVSFCAYLAISFCFFLFQDFLAPFLGFSPLYLLFIPLIAVFTSWVEVLKITYIIRGRAVPFGGFLLGLTLLDLSLSLFFIINVGLGVEGRVLGILMSKAVFGVVAICLLWKNGDLHLRFSKGYAEDVFRFGLPLLPHALGGILLHSSDQYFINEMMGKDELGIYSIAYRIGSVIMLLDISFNQVFSPHVMKTLKAKTIDGYRGIVKASYLYALGLFVSFCLLLFALPWLFEWFVESRYTGGMKYVPLIALGYVFLGLYKVFTNYLFYLKKTKLIGMITLSCAVLNMGLNYFFIAWHGTIGAAEATLISYAMFFLATAYFANKHFPMPWLAVFRR